MFTECDNCAGFSLCKDNVPFYRDPRHTVPDGIRCFCSPTCKRVYFEIATENVFECADCKRHIVEMFRWTIVCPPCYGRRLLKTGQPSADFGGHFYHARMPSDKWISDAEIVAVGYTSLATIIDRSFDVNAIVMRTIAYNVGSAVIAQPIMNDTEDAENGIVVYRPGRNTNSVGGLAL